MRRTAWVFRVAVGPILAGGLLLVMAAPVRSGDLPLDELLLRVGDRVDEFWQEFSSIACQETVSQVRMNEKGKVVNSREATYDYLVLMQWLGNQPSVDESRVLESELKPKKKKRPSQRSLLVTNGFSIMLLVFHPHYQNSYLFTRGSDEEVEGHNVARVDFEHVSGARSPSVLQLADRRYALEWKGSAWIDPESGSILKMEVGLKEPMEQIGLERLDAEVVYGEVWFQDAEETYWLPRFASIEAETAHQLWQNRHEFTDYKRFSVNTQVSIGEVR